MARFEITTREMVEHAALSGSADHLYELGLAYCTGRDVEVDMVEAHKWFNLAAMRGNVEARRYRTEIAREMSRIEVARAQRLAREWLTRH